MDKNHIEGRYGTTSWHNTAKSSGLPVEVNVAVVQGSIVQLPGITWGTGDEAGDSLPKAARRVSGAKQICPARAWQKSAEAIVVEETSWSAKEHVKISGGLINLTKGRIEEEGTDRPADTQPDTVSRRGERESRCGGMHGDSQASEMMERILDPTNVEAAWKPVKSNKGAPGIDGMTIEAFPEFFRANWPRIRAALKTGTYRPAAVRRVFIPKPDGTERPLRVPTVLDRVIQQAIAQVLNPLFEEDFREKSYGFREGRNAHQAIRELRLYTQGWLGCFSISKQHVQRDRFAQ